MSDKELEEWDARQRAHITSPQTLAAFVRGPAGKVSKPRVDVSEYQ